MRLDKVTMANSVEGREPFLDHRLVELALALPPHLKHRDGVGKWTLRRAMRGILPDELIDRSKQGIGTPMEEWLRDRPAPSRTLPSGAPYRAGRPPGPRSGRSVVRRPSSRPR